MNKLEMLAIIIVVLVIAAGIVIYLYPELTGSEPYWETPNEFGSWGQELILEYEDGTSQSVKPLVENELLSVYHSGKKVTGYQYKIKGKASGVGWDTVEVDFSEFVVTVNSKDASDDIWNFYPHSFTSVTSFSVDDQWYSLCSISGGITNVFLDEMRSGIYTLNFVPSGSIRYKANPDGDWEIGNLPDCIGLTMEVQKDQDVLSVTFAGEATTFDTF